MNRTVENISDIAREIDLIAKVDSFYNSAWNKLIIVGSVAFAIVGVIVPFVIQWYQKRTLKLSEEIMKKEFSEHKKILKEEIYKEVAHEIENKFEKYEKELRLANASANAKIFFSQGKFSLEKNYFSVALNEFITAAHSCMDGNDFQTLQKILKSILEDCLPNLSREEIDDLRISDNKDLNSLLVLLSQHDNSGVFQDVIGSIKVKITKLPKNIKDKPSEQTKK
ncbi:MAG TPA: hypothetical protein PLW37_03020 [bacterium]|nr:hypothetical protein [bacterium]